MGSVCPHIWLPYFGVFLRRGCFCPSEGEAVTTTVNESVFYLHHLSAATERGQLLAGPAACVGREHTFLVATKPSFFFSLLLTLENVLKERRGL